MMNTYEQEIFNFFSEQQNFANMIKVASHYDFIKKELLTRFWKEVDKKLQALNKENGEKWIIKFSGDIFITNTKLLIYKSSWYTGEPLPPLAIAFERMASNHYPYYGLWVNKDSAVIKYDTIMQYARSLPMSAKFQKDTDLWWPFWEASDINFTHDEELIKILPVNSQALIESLANTLFNLANSMEGELDKMAQMRK